MAIITYITLKNPKIETTIIFTAILIIVIWLFAITILVIELKQTIKKKNTNELVEDDKL